MDLQLLRRLLKIFDQSTASEMELETEGFKLRLKKKSEHPLDGKAEVPAAALLPPQLYHSNVLTPPPTASTAPAASSITVEEQEGKQEESKEGEETELHTIVAPIVGTFYRAPAPDAEPFVKVGDHVNPGDTLCIIEAMKLMNEIESDVAGTIVKILVENAQPVEYGQPLFLIKPDK